MTLPTCDPRDVNFVEVWGQSNSNGMLWPAVTGGDPFAQGDQANVLLTRHATLNVGSVPQVDTNWQKCTASLGPQNSFGAPGVPSIGFAQAIASNLQTAIPRLAIAQMGYGGTDSSFWVTTYSGYVAWLNARLAQLLGTTRPRFGVIYQGESNAINNTVASWQPDWTGIVAARRAAWGVTLPFIIVRIPDTTPIARLANIQAAQAALVAAVPKTYLVTDNTATMGAGPDIDGPSTARIGHIVAACAVANGL